MGFINTHTHHWEALHYREVSAQHGDFIANINESWTLNHGNVGGTIFQTNPGVWDSKS